MALRWRVYWFAGLAVFVAGIVATRRRGFVGNALSIAGVNLMLVGNNGGFYATGYE